MYRRRFLYHVDTYLIMQTQQMMETLNKLWTEYDVICKRWGIYKVETIGGLK
jgi:hypothetical protein